MITNVLKLKCLFGHHTYDEVWGHSSKLDSSLLKVCIVCRKVAHYCYEIKDTYPWVMEILFENEYYFKVKAPSKVIYRFEKQKFQKFAVAIEVFS